MLEASNDSSAWLVAPNSSVINELFIDSFHALYNIQIDNLHTQELFDTGASINASFIVPYNILKCYPPTEK